MVNITIKKEIVPSEGQKYEINIAKEKLMNKNTKEKLMNKNTVALTIHCELKVKKRWSDVTAITVKRTLF